MSSAERKPEQLADVCAELGIIAICKYGAPENATFPDADPWTVRLDYKRRRMTVPFYCGRGHNGTEPTAADVLSCLISDVTSVEDARDFEDWCGDFGWSTDSRAAERTWKICERLVPRLRRFLGDDFDRFAAAEH